MKSTPDSLQPAPILQNDVPMSDAGVKIRTSSASKAGRNPALDFTKGALVLIMVLYHWLNYFYTAEGDIYRYLRFLTPSFIFITGFLVSNVYLSKYGATDPRLPRRLTVRGLKILGVFVVLNLVRGLLLPGSAREQLLADHSSFRNLVDIYVVGANVGAGQGKAIAFFVLVPIAYLLILSALLIAGARLYRYFFHLVFVLSVIAAVALDSIGQSSANLELVAIGLMGVIVGYMPIEKVDALVKHPYVLFVAYVLYVAAITVWNVTYLLQIVGVCLSVMIIYLIGQTSGEPGRVRGVVILLGKYSLLGYIAQIAVLQLLHQGLRHTNFGRSSALAISFVAAFALTILAIDVTDRARRKVPPLDRLYRAVFA